MTPASDPRDQEIAARRKSARRTALWFAVVATGIYVAFIMSGVLGR